MKIISDALIVIIRSYQLTAGRLMPRVCRYEPTCSQYAIEALRAHPLLRALALSAWRLFRCNPWCDGGHDRVPVKQKTGIRGCEKD